MNIEDIDRILNNLRTNISIVAVEDEQMLLNYIQEKDKEIERLNNKVDELMELYTTERHCKDDYKSIIKEVREYIDIDENIRKTCKRYDVNGIAILEILNKGE